MPFTKKAELLIAAKADDLDTIKSFFDVLIDEAPTKVDIVYALKVANTSKSLKTIEYFCLSGELNQSEISENLISICNMDAPEDKFNLISTLCALSNANKPTQIAIDKAFATLAEAGKWELLKTLCESENSPSQEAVGNLIKKAGQKNSNIFSRSRNKIVVKAELPLEIMTFLFERSKTQPNKEDVDQTLDLLLKKDLKDPIIWDFIGYLCALSGENKPSQTLIEAVLKAAVQSNKGALVKTLGLLEGENALTRQVIAELLIKVSRESILKDVISVEIVQLLCETTRNNPLSKDIDTAINAALINHQKNWDYIKYFCSLKTANKPSQASIDKVLQEARKASDWDYVKSLCSDSLNPPSQKALGDLLKCAAIKASVLPSKSLNRQNPPAELPYDVLIFLFESSVTKLLKSDVSYTLMEILNNKDLDDKKTLDAVSYLCALTGSNKPIQDAINLALRISVKKNKHDLVKQLCLMKGDNAPDQKTVGNQLISCSSLDQRMPLILLLCEASYNSPTQADLSASVAEALKSSPIKKDYLTYFTSMKTANRPNQEAIDKVLYAVAKENDWTYINYLCEIDNTPSQKAIDSLLKFAASVKQIPSKNRAQAREMPYEVMVHLFEQSIIKPSKEAVSFTLKDILDRCDLKSEQNWVKINYLCALNGDNKPSQEAINTVLRRAIVFAQQDLVNKLCTMKADNAPEHKVVASTLIEFAGMQQINIPVETIAMLCEHSIHKPTQSDVSAALEAASGIKNWAYVSYFSKMETDNKPSQAAINKALEAAATAGNWELVKRLCLIDNLPGQKAIGFALKRAPLDTIKFLLETSLVKPDKEDVSQYLNQLSSRKKNWADYDKLQCIAYLAALTGEIKPSSLAIKGTLLYAVLNQNQEIVKQICLMQSDNAPTQKDFEFVLQAKTISLEAIKSLCELPKNPPGPEAIDKAFIAATSSQSLEKFQYFCQKMVSQTAINKALIGAATNDLFEDFRQEEAVVIMQCLFEAKFPDQEAINEALKTAASSGWLSVVKFLCELGENSPDKVAIEEAFLNAVPFQLEMVEYLLKRINPLSQERLVDIALQKTQHIEVISYLQKFKVEKLNSLVNQKETKVIESHDSSAANQKTQTDNSLALAEQNSGTYKTKSSSNKPIKAHESINLDPSNARTKHSLPSSSYKTLTNTLFKKAINHGDFKSCFSFLQIRAINTRIKELENEIGGCFSFFINTDRKQEKIAGLLELLKIGQQPGMTIPDAIEQVINDERFPELRAGYIFNRTSSLFDELLDSAQSPAIR
ncbi:MAG: hypothetical protein H0U57_03580 [Tatlockia sp.]|nr:hypothetical protein [Tatlockia sp.]